MDPDAHYAAALLRLTTTRCFSVEAARTLGLPGHVLRRSVYRRSSRSIRFLDSAPPEVSDVVACLGTLSPGTVASNETAAALWGLPLPRRSDDAPIHLTRPPGTTRPRRAGVVGHVAALGEDDVVTVYGVPLTSPARTWCDLGARLPFPALVAAGDALLRRPDAPRRAAAINLPDPLCTLDTLSAAVATRRGARGQAAVRAALPLLRSGVDSAPESMLRMLILDAGLPEPEVNRWILDEDGRVSRPDLQYRRQRVALEYEGEHHLTDPRQWARDIERDERLRALGWTVLRFTKRHLGAGREDAMARIRYALAVAGQDAVRDRRSRGQK
ncbi:endonuclease domain-containing protein [Arthrobacter sp. Ld5]|uniref:endonuclease domain-containing protein n=1 Tax=Arthrobacter sp. Ld5 TaxID=649152 RepID=UPI003EB74573